MSNSKNRINHERAVAVRRLQDEMKSLGAGVLVTIPTYLSRVVGDDPLDRLHEMLVGANALLEGEFTMDAARAAKAVITEARELAKVLAEAVQ